jgi:hypothetical protein
MDEFLVRRAATRLSTLPSECPSADALAAALDERLPSAEREALDAHLAGCPACATVVRDFAGLREAAVCPPVLELLRSTAFEPHTALCPGCAQIREYARTHEEEAKALVDLLEAQGRARALGVAVSATAVIAALLARRAALGGAAQGRVHRSRQGSLGATTARPRRLTWTPLGHEEDTWIVVLTTDRGEARLRTHEPMVELDEEAWKKLGVEPGRSYRWGVTAMRNGKAVEKQEGWVRFMAEDEVAALAEKEAVARKMPTERAMLALAWIYRGLSLYWEACGVLWAYVQRHPAGPVGHLLMGQVCEEMDRVQEASRAMGQANRLLAPGA